MSRHRSADFAFVAAPTAAVYARSLTLELDALSAIRLRALTKRYLVDKLGPTRLYCVRISRQVLFQVYKIYSPEDVTRPEACPLLD